MTITTTHRVRKIDDQTLHDTFQRIMGVFDDTFERCQYELIPGIPVPHEEINDLPDWSGRYAIDNATLLCRLSAQTTFHLVFRRRIKTGGAFVSTSQYDEFELNFNRDQNDWSHHKEKIKDINAILGSLGLPEPTGGATDDVGTLRDLLVGFGATHRHMLDTLNDEIRAIAIKRAEFEEENAKKEEERIEAHKAALRELQEERSKLQLQSYKAERRRIMQSLTDEEAKNLRKNLTPKGAIWTRWAVFGAALLLSGFAALFAFVSLKQLGVDDALASQIAQSLPEGADSSKVHDAVTAALGTTDWFLIGRSVVSSLVAIGGLLYAANWLKSFYQGEVETARAIDQFNYDLVRASWVIETVLEVKHEHGGEIPQEWIEGVTRGLFNGAADGERLDDPYQALRALMGFTAGASFGPEGPKIELSRKDARKLSKAGSE